MGRICGRGLGRRHIFCKRSPSPSEMVGPRIELLQERMIDIVVTLAKFRDGR